MDETGLDSLSMFPPGSKQSAVTLDITSTIGSVVSPFPTEPSSQPISLHLDMPQSSTRLSWMGQHTHRIQAGEPGPSNPDGRRQLARRTAWARGETPFEYNQYNHKVWGGLDAEMSTSNQSILGKSRSRRRSLSHQAGDP